MSEEHEVVDFIGGINAHLKKKSDRHYRLVRLDAENVGKRKLQGYRFLGKDSSEVKGTILEKEMSEDGLIKAGRLAIASIPTGRHEQLKARVEEKSKRRMNAIEHAYREEGERVKRQMGKAGKHVKMIFREEKE